jgi:serine O-acetyltransferase
MFLFSTDIVMSSQIGESFFMPHPVGIAFMAKVGNNATFYAQTGIAARKGKDIGAGIAMSILGDNVVLGAFSKVVGPIRIGNNVTVAPATVVLKDVPDNVTVYGVPAKIIKHRVERDSVE